MNDGWEARLTVAISDAAYAYAPMYGRSGDSNDCADWRIAFIRLCRVLGAWLEAKHGGWAEQKALANAKATVRAKIMRLSDADVASLLVDAPVTLAAKAISAAMEKRVGREGVRSVLDAAGDWIASSQIAAERALIETMLSVGGWRLEIVGGLATRRDGRRSQSLSGTPQGVVEA